MANTKTIAESKTKSLPRFPVLVVGKHRRVMTKHFCNLALWLPSAELELLNFLCYEALADNTFKYDTFLLERYSSAAKLANLQYRGVSVMRNLTKSRGCLKNLIELGLILQTGTKNKLIINPMLTYNSDVVNNKKYKEVQELYQVSGINNISDMTKHFSNIVSEFLESKKKNYKYGKKH